MMETFTLGAFLLLTLALYGTPGPATLSLAASGAAFGLRRSMPYVLGILAGLAINVLLVAGGLGTLLTIHPGARRAFQVFSLVFLLYLAWKLATAEPATESTESAEGRRFSALEGLVLNVTNPKAYIAALVVLAPFLAEGGGAGARWARISGLLAGILAVAAVVNVGWVVAGGFLGRAFSSPRASRILNATLAALLAISAVVATLAV